MPEIEWTVAPVSVPASGSSRRFGAESTRVDVRLLHAADGGEIESVNGVITMDAGLETAVYLSLFGGNEQDGGLQGDDSKQWWGNLTETDPSRKYRSETQKLLRSIPAIPVNMRRIEDAIGRDLAWMVDSGLASLVSALVTIPGLNRINIAINIEIGDQAYEIVFAEKWGATS